jgi:hypothetical protein
VHLVAVVALAVAGGAGSGAEQRGAVTRAVSTKACASDQGAGVKTNRRFCDVIVASTARDSVSVPIPAHTGPATLLFDLHNRFTVPPAGVGPAQSFARHTAVVAVIRLTGEIIDRAAVNREYRTPADLFDRISGGRGNPPKAVAPGQAQAVRVTIPAGITAVGIVGLRLEEWTVTGQGASVAPGRPIAMLSNLRIEYRPR